MPNQIILQDIRNIIINIRKEAKQLEGQTLLISGGAGFLGSYFVSAIDYLNRKKFKKPCRVISIDNYITGKKRKILEEVDGSNIEFINGDVTKPLMVEKEVDYIIHAAGLASPVYYQKYPLETIESAIFGTKNLLELAKINKIKSFLYFSSSEIYGDPSPDFVPTPETYKGNVSSIGPRACYDESKRLGETICMTYHHLFGIPVKIVRPFNIYGPGMMSDDYRVVPTFISKALKKEPIPVHDEGNQTRTFCYISDAIAGFFKVLLSSKNGEVYNVGNDDLEINMMSLAQLVSELLNGKAEIKTIPYPKRYPADEPRRRKPDLTKIKTTLGYQPSVDLKKGLKRTMRWYKTEGYV